MQRGAVCHPSIGPPLSITAEAVLLWVCVWTRRGFARTPLPLAMAHDAYYFKVSDGGTATQPPPPYTREAYCVVEGVPVAHLCGGTPPDHITHGRGGRGFATRCD
eukprot:TRINITY_DN23611_c1_g1_i1.p3 TRINITY_DN23611_c1_g1~~TRINITY_DN23611_c1_g1_i1.p3  ORF type:complete len:105 (-),score=0.46 TRINITY_DN23611_c1_g1_i1:73-387(-)